MEIIGIWPAG